MTGLGKAGLFADIALAGVVTFVAGHLFVAWWQDKRGNDISSWLSGMKASWQSPALIGIGLAGGGLKLIVSVAILLGYQ